MRRTTLLALVFVACRTRNAASVDVSLPDAPRAEAAAPSPGADASPPPEPPPPTPAWCWRAKGHVDLRAIDAQGGVWAVRGATLLDETHGVASPLPSEIPCMLRGTWRAEFLRDGTAFLVADSRFYVRASEADGFAVTPLCTDLEGPAWSRRAQGGWSFVSHRDATVEPTLMLSRAPKGDTGWYAITGLDGSTRAVALDGSDSYAALTIGRHLVFVDRQNTVAGEVFAAQGASFTTMSRTAAGVTVSRDDDGRRTVVFTESVTGTYARAVGTRPPGPAATEVFRVDLARFLAVTPAGVELSNDRGVTWQRVLEHPSLTRAHLGWLPGHRLAVATTDGIASDTCPD